MRISWASIVDLVTDQDFCDDMEFQDVKEERLVRHITAGDVKFDENGEPFKSLVKDLLWASSEYNNSEYASEAPGDRSSHAKGYREHMKRAKATWKGLTSPS